MWFPDLWMKNHTACWTVMTVAKGCNAGTAGGLVIDTGPDGIAAQIRLAQASRDIAVEHTSTATSPGGTIRGMGGCNTWKHMLNCARSLAQRQRGNRLSV